MWQKMGSVIDRYGAQKTLYDFGEAFEIDLSHEFQLYTFARSSSDNFSSLFVRGNLTLDSGSKSHIYFFRPSFLEAAWLIFLHSRQLYLFNITVGIA